MYYAASVATWQEQWERVNRMLKRVNNAYTARPVAVDTDDLRDDIYSFAQNVHHLKDWLRHDPSTGLSKSDVEGVIDGSPELQICADLCNGSKHLKLHSSRTGDPTTAITKNSVEIQPGTPTVLVGNAPIQMRRSTRATVRHTFSVESAGMEYDALDLAQRAGWSGGGS